MFNSCLLSIWEVKTPSYLIVKYLGSGFPSCGAKENKGLKVTVKVRSSDFSLLICFCPCVCTLLGQMGLVLKFHYESTEVHRDRTTPWSSAFWKEVAKPLVPN